MSEVVRILRRTGGTALWLAAILGIVCGLIWLATAVSWIKPLIVVSGSMEPTIMTGDLLVARPQPTADLQVGEVASIYSDVVDRIITHRVAEKTQTGPASWEVLMKGDANEAQDGGAYELGATVWQPEWRIPGGGRVVMALMQRRVVVPLLITLVSLLMLSLIPGDRPEGDRTELVPAEDQPEDAGEQKPANAPRAAEMSRRRTP